MNNIDIAYRILKNSLLESPGYANYRFSWAYEKIKYVK